MDTTSRLLVLLEVVEQGSFAKAAEIMHQQVNDDLLFMSKSPKDKIFDESDEKWLFKANETIHRNINVDEFNIVHSAVSDWLEKELQNK